MPREQRKRGKKHKKSDNTNEHAAHNDYPEPEPEPAPEPAAGPSWIKPAPAREHAPDIDAPFGLVDPDVKAYFRNVDTQMRDWAEHAPDAPEDGADGDGADVCDPNEDRRMFFVAALDEMAGKERVLATDPDCSAILERMAYSMDDFVRRVFLDALSGSYEQLVKHRFASHVVQTMLEVAPDTINRECRGIFPPAPASSGDSGELRPLSQLVSDLCEELLPSTASLLADPFASHVLRALLILLRPALAPAAGHGAAKANLRSRKSAAWKARQGPLRSVFADDAGKPAAGARTLPKVPKTFGALARRVVEAVRGALGANEVRALAADKVASPLLQLLLALEAELRMADEAGSLMDHVLDGLVSFAHANADGATTAPPESDYLSALLRDPTASHTLEAVLAHAPAPVRALLFRVHLGPKLLKLAQHPVANFVVQRALARAAEAEFGEAVDVLAGAAGRLVKMGRVGVLRSLVLRAGELNARQADVVSAVYSAFGLDRQSEDDVALFVPCIMRLQGKQEYLAAQAGETQDADGEDPATRKPAQRKRDAQWSAPTGPTTQGSLLLQALAQLSAPHHSCVLSSLLALDPPALLALAHDNTASRVLDALLAAPAVPARTKRRVILAFVPVFAELVDDRVGARVGERLWAAADPYLQEKIGRSLLSHEHALRASPCARPFARGLQLHVLRRNADEWRELHAASAAAAAAASAQEKRPPPAEPEGAEPATDGKRRKRKRRAPDGDADVDGDNDLPGGADANADADGAEGGDAIDALFAGAGLGGKTHKRGALAAAASATPDAASPVRDSKPKKAKKEKKGDGAELGDVLGAIRDAPKGEARKRRKAG